MTSALYGPTISELRHVPFSSVDETTYFMVSFMNGAPGSSSAVRGDHAGSNISYVVRPSRIPWAPAMAPAIASPIAGSKPYSNVHRGSSMTPSRDMNSCTRMSPMVSASWRVTRGRSLRPLFAYVTSGRRRNRHAGHAGRQVPRLSGAAGGSPFGAVEEVVVVGAELDV